MKSTYYLFLIPVILFSFFFLFPLSYILNGKILAKKEQMDRVFENWLQVKSEIALLFLNRDGAYKNDKIIIDVVEVFEYSLESLLDEKGFEVIEKNSPMMRDYRAILISEWVDIQLELVKLVSDGKNLTFYADELYKMIHKSPFFEKNLKEVIFSVKYYLEKEYGKTIIVILLLSLAVIFFYIFSVKGVLKIKEIKQTEAETKKISRLLIKIRETERVKIALEIHDVLIHRIMDIKKSVEELVYNKPELANIESNLFETIQIARRISFSLRPVELQKNFLESVQYYCTEISWQHNLTIDCAISGFKNIVLEESLEINIFRIIQEALSNIIRHSKADTAEVNLLYSHPLVVLTISDNGIGISDNVIDKLNKNVLDIQHMGLQGMKDRVKLFDGSFYIKKTIDSGCLIKIKMPYYKEKYQNA